MYVYNSNTYLARQVSCELVVYKENHLIINFLESLFLIYPNFQSKVDDFLQLVSSTVQSFQVTYSDGVPQESSEEVQFVLALCGIITSNKA